MIFHEIVELTVKDILYAEKSLYQHLNQVVLTINNLCEFTTQFQKAIVIRKTCS